jgi:uroporphyrinogen decarboxylase
MLTRHPSLVTSLRHQRYALLLWLAIPFVVVSSSSSSSSLDPLLLRVARGESSIGDRTPVWMMRQAGRHMAAYRDLCETHPTFRERSETHELSVEISCQPVDACE